MMHLSEIRQPHHDQSLDEYIEDHDIAHFSAKECRTLKRLGVTAPEPPRRLWPNVIPTLWLAEGLRERMGCPLLIGNGYRPKDLNRRVGGARYSRHITFRALDLDLGRYASSGDQGEFYRCAAEIFLEHREEYGAGLGLYRAWKGSRIHLDTGRRRSAHWKRAYTTPLLRSLR